VSLGAVKIDVFALHIEFDQSVTLVAHAVLLQEQSVQARVSEAVVPARRVLVKPAGQVCGPVLEMHILKPGAFGRQRVVASHHAAALVGGVQARPSVVFVLVVEAAGVHAKGPAGGVTLPKPVLPTLPSKRSVPIAVQAARPVLLFRFAVVWAAAHAASSPVVIAVVAPAHVGPLPPLPVHVQGHVTAAEPLRTLRSVDV